MFPTSRRSPSAGPAAAPSSPARAPKPACARARLRAGQGPRLNAAARQLLSTAGDDGVLVLAAARALLRQLIAGRGRATCVLRLPDGRRYRLDGASHVGPAGGREAVCRIVQRSRKRAARDVQPRRAALADALLYPVWLVDATGGVVHENPAARGLRCTQGPKTKLAGDGGQRKEALGPWPLEQVHPEERQALLHAWGAARDEVRPLEVACRLESGAGGAYRWQLARAQPQASASGAHHWVLSLQDQHEAHTMREDLRTAACMRDNFLRVASHELSTPLTSLQLALQLALARVARVAPEPERRALLADPIGRALGETRRLVELVSDLLDIKRLQAGKFFLRRGPVHLGEMLRELFARLEVPMRDAGCTLEFTEDSACRGQWDAVRLQQVFFHLLSNAIKYAPGSCLHVRCGASGNAAYVTVEDEGPGIPVGLRKKIFSLFERATEVRGTSGLGMGLYLCRRIVHAHHGNLRLVCRGERGAKFVVVLPRAEERGLNEVALGAKGVPVTAGRPAHS